MGIKVENQIEIARPPEEVFEYLTDGENLSEWMRDFESVEKTSEGPIGKGTKYRYRLSKPDKISTFEYVDFEPGRRAAWEGPPVKTGPGGLAPRGRFELEPARDGTVVHAIYEPEPHGYMKVMGPVVAYTLRKDSTRDLQRLKEILEKGGSGEGESGEGGSGEGGSGEGGSGEGGSEQGGAE
jgi:uncharacterized protein YndB with AHSA1/START domain